MWTYIMHLAQYLSANEVTFLGRIQNFLFPGLVAKSTAQQIHLLNSLKQNSINTKNVQMAKNIVKWKTDIYEYCILD